MIIKKGTLIMYKDETSLKENISQVPHLTFLYFIIFYLVKFRVSNNLVHGQIRSQHSHIMFVLFYSFMTSKLECHVLLSKIPILFQFEEPILHCVVEREVKQKEKHVFKFTLVNLKYFVLHVSQLSSN